MKRSSQKHIQWVRRKRRATAIEVFLRSNAASLVITDVVADNSGVIHARLDTDRRVDYMDDEARDVCEAIAVDLREYVGHNVYFDLVDSRFVFYVQ